MTTGRNVAYKKVSVSSTSYPSEAHFKFGFKPSRVMIINDSNLNVDFSFNKTDLDGEIISTDHHLAFDELAQDKIWFKLSSATGPAQLRIWAWRL